MFSWYQRSLTRRPVLTQSLTTACLFALGDSIAQQGVEKKGLYNHDVIRTGRMTFYGGAIFGPIAANWFRFLQNKVRLPSKRVTLLVRVAADQLLCAPIVTGIFLTSMSVMEGTNPKEKLERVYWKALRANWSIWPAFQAVNLSMVPAQYQVLAVNVFNIAWNCFLSLLNSTF